MHYAFNIQEFFPVILSRVIWNFEFELVHEPSKVRSMKKGCNRKRHWFSVDLNSPSAEIM